MGRAKARGITNLKVVTCDMNNFVPESTYDRIVSIEMFEHMKNYQVWFVGPSDVFLSDHRNSSEEEILLILIIRIAIGGSFRSLTNSRYQIGQCYDHHCQPQEFLLGNKQEFLIGNKQEFLIRNTQEFLIRNKKVAIYDDSNRAAFTLSVSHKPATLNDMF